MGLNINEKMLIEQRVTNESKSAGIAYLLWFFLGYLGVHRFYIGATGTAVAQLLLAVIGALTAVILIGFVFIFILAVWWIVDLFLIPGMVSSYNNSVREKFTQEVLLDQRNK